MTSKAKQPKSANISDVHKQILEIKKKIQLSEGQRKALFEIREAECKTNITEISKLKKAISELVLALRVNKSNSAKNRIKSARLEQTMGPLGEKTCDKTQEILDLHIIDKSKRLNLIRYHIQKKQNYLTTLANEYQVLVSEKRKKELIQKVETPLKVTSSELQNNIHAVKIQWREATHVNNRYADIKTYLRQDAARFEFNIKCAEEQLRVQSIEIERLQKIAEEASDMRGTARAALLQQEKAALQTAKSQSHQLTEGKRLVLKGKQELEKLERRIFQSGRPLLRSEPEIGEDSQIILEESSTSPQNDDIIESIFETLKQTTGSSTYEEVVDRFRAQKDTDVRLNRLRNNSEVEKRQLEKKQEALTMELEHYKYAEAKDAERNLEEVEKLHNSIEEQKELKTEHEKSKENTQKVVQLVTKSLNSLMLAIHPLAVSEENPEVILKYLNEEFEDIIAELDQTPVADKQIIVEKLELEEDKLPPPYTSLVRQTPISEEETSPIPQPTGSEDEEEVPTRGYLKRQAQLVVDARSRRKNIRIQRK